MSDVEPKPGMIAANLGEPILLKGVNVSGVAAQAARSGEMAQIYTRLAITSDERAFHVIAEGLANVINHHAAAAGTHVSLDRAGTIVLIIKEDDSAELWVDTAAVSINVLVKRAMAAGSPVFQRDIADILGMSFPLLQFDPSDRLVVLFRKAWAFGLYFDFNPDKNLSVELATRSLGRLYRILAYRHLYDTVSNEAVFERLVSAGWFPFVEILAQEFRELANHCEAEFPLEELETKLVAGFDDARLNHMLQRWGSKPHFASKMPLLEAAVAHFKAGDAIAAIKIAVTEIEGVLRGAYTHPTISRPRIHDLLQFAIDAAVNKTGEGDTLLLPEAFGRYLSGYIFAQFDPALGTGHAGSRHAVGHGAADASSFTKARALQALLTLDQLAFYT